MGVELILSLSCAFLDSTTASDEWGPLDQITDGQLHRLGLFSTMYSCFFLSLCRMR